jgi:branched-chain amino acid transport system substrate-binding protein
VESSDGENKALEALTKPRTKQEGVMRKSAIYVGFLLFVCVVWAFIVGGLERPAAAADPIKIGVVLSITGWGGFIGTPEKEAMVAVAEQVNRKGGVLGRQIELLIEDDQSNPTTAVIATTKLVRDLKVCMVLGPAIADSGMAMIPILEKEEVPFPVSGPVITPYKKWVFNVTPNDIINSSQVLEYAVNGLGGKRIAVIHDTAKFGMTGWKVFEDEIKKYPGASIVAEEKFDTADTTVVPQLSKIKAANPDVIIVQSPGAQAAVVAKSYKQLGMRNMVTGPPGMASPEFLKIAGPIAEERGWVLIGDRILVGEKLPANEPYRKNTYDPFKKLIKEKYGESRMLSVFHAVGHDAIYIAVAALQTAGSDDRAAIRDALEKVRFEGMLGNFAGAPDDHRGFAKSTCIPIVVQGNEYVPYKK